MDGKREVSFLTLVCLLTLFLGGCGVFGKAGGSASASGDIAADNISESDISFDKEDLSWDYNESDAAKITLEGEAAAVFGDGAYVNGGVITIKQAGYYLVTGTLNDGQLKVDCADSGRVCIILKNASITCKSGAPIYILAAEKTVITLADGSENYLVDSESFVQNADGEPSACIFSKDDLVINGTGLLDITANYNDGITGKDDLRIVSGSINITAVDDGVVGKDLIAILTAQLSIKAGGDGLKASNDTDAGKGVISIEDGRYTIAAGCDGLQAESELQILGGQFDITTAGGGIAAAEQDAGIPAADGGGRQIGEIPARQADEADTSSAKGIKSALALYIGGGEFTIDSLDDAVHCNGSIKIAGGRFDIASGDDGIHADEGVVIDGGNIVISKSYEGIEGANITINDGEFDITASDDGINISGGGDAFAMGGMPGRNALTEDSDYTLAINGGRVNINANGDGIDSNGSITMTGGEVTIDGPINSGNGALDYMSGFTMTGGQLIAAGSIGMAQAISDTSTVYCISLGLSTAQEAGGTVRVKDANGGEVISYTGEKRFQSVVVASEKFKKGESYTVYCDDEQVGAVTLSSVITSVGTAAEQGQNRPGAAMPGGVEPPQGGIRPGQMR